MWRNRLGLLLILALSVVGVFSLTRSAQSSEQAMPAPADNRFSLVQMNFEAGNTRMHTLVRIDHRTGRAWFVRPKGGTTWEWVDLNEAGSKPMP